MSDYITTYSGTHFFPTEPDMKDFHIRDVAHALSFICRGNASLKPSEASVKTGMKDVVWKQNFR